MQDTLDQMDFATARALLEWQVALGADEAIGDVPVNRYQSPESRGAAARPRDDAGAAAPAVASPAAYAPLPQAVAVDAPDPVIVARQAAQAAQTLDGLEAAIAAYEFCELKRGARNTVFADGNPAARVMIIGEAPGREEDATGRPFVGAAGKLLDRMFSAISMARDAVDAERALYITNIMPWRPPQNRPPSTTEIAMMLPFVERHVELAGPDILVLMGRTPCLALLGRTGITRTRGQWTEVLGRPALPMFHPAYLLRTPSAKRLAWNDLLSLQARLRKQT